MRVKVMRGSPSSRLFIGVRVTLAFARAIYSVRKRRRRPLMTLAKMIRLVGGSLPHLHNRIWWYEERERPPSDVGFSREEVEKRKLSIRIGSCFVTFCVYKELSIRVPST